MNRRLKEKTLSLNPFKGKASLVLRELVKNPSHKWSGTDLAKQLDLSQSWVNRVLDTLVQDRLAQRSMSGLNSFTEIISCKEIVKRWSTNYNINTNIHLTYLSLNEGYIENLVKLSKKHHYSLAFTGYYAAETHQGIKSKAIPMCYMRPALRSDSVDKLLSTIENLYDFIPTEKNSNLIIIIPKQNSHVFFDKRVVKGLPIVSPLQLYLDLHALSGGKDEIEKMHNYFKKNNIYYELLEEKNDK